MKIDRYEYLLRHAKRAYPRYRTKEHAAKAAASDAVALEHDLTREERRAFCNRLVKTLLSKT